MKCVAVVSCLKRLLSKGCVNCRLKWLIQIGGLLARFCLNLLNPILVAYF